MKTFLAVTLFLRILTFAFAIGGGADDDGNDFSKCDVVTPKRSFDSKKFFGKLKHMYATHARYAGRLGVCRELYTKKYSNGTISYNYEFDGNGIPEDGIKSYKANCTGTEDRKQKGKFSFNCIQKYYWELDYFKHEFLFPCHTDEEYSYDTVEDEEKQELKEEVLEELIESAEGDDKEHTHEFPLTVTVLSTDYKKYAIIHSCAEISHEYGNKSFVDNYVVFNKEENAELPKMAKQKFKRYKWEEDKFATRKICNKKEEIKK